MMENEAIRSGRVRRGVTWIPHVPRRTSDGSGWSVGRLRLQHADVALGNQPMSAEGAGRREGEGEETEQEQEAGGGRTTW